MKNRESGITLISLSVTIVLMIILMGIMISSNSINEDAAALANEKNAEAELLSITEDIKNYLTENPPADYEELIMTLKRYGDITNETDATNATLITNKGGYEIKVREIWNLNPEDHVQDDLTILQ